MPLTREKKKEILDELKSSLAKSKSAVFVNFHGLSVGDATSLRKALKVAGVEYIVAKKTLVKKALSESKVSGELPTLDGELAIALSNDLIAPARGVYEFQKKLEGKVAILGGIFEGEFKDKAAMVSIASIPSLKVLHGQFVNLINSPLQGLVIALNAIAEKKQ